MKTPLVAEFLNARSAGRGRFSALCPAHPDRSPSLAISEGTNGCTLLKCWAGCSLDAILAAAGLKLSDLFANTDPISRDAWQVLQRRRVTAEAWQQAYVTVTREAFDQERQAWQQVNSLGAELARLSDSDPTAIEITERFHAACGDFAKAEQESRRLLTWRLPHTAPQKVKTSGQGMVDVAA